MKDDEVHSRHHGHRSLEQRVNQLEEERKRDDKWQKRAGERLSALEQHVGDGALLIVEAIDRLTAAMSRTDTGGHSSIHVVEVGPMDKEPHMSPGAVDISPDFRFASSRNYAILAVVGPLMKNGEYSAGGGWSTSDEATIGVPDPNGFEEFLTQADPNWVDPGDGTFPPQVPILDDQGRQIPVYKCKVLTPLDPDPGVDVFAIVTRKATGMADVQIKCIYSNPDVGHSVITASEFPEEPTP